MDFGAHAALKTQRPLGVKQVSILGVRMKGLLEAWIHHGIGLRSYLSVVSASRFVA